MRHAVLFVHEKQAARHVVQRAQPCGGVELALAVVQPRIQVALRSGASTRRGTIVIILFITIVIIYSLVL